MQHRATQIVEDSLGHSPFRDINSKYKLQQYLVSDCGMIKPKKVIIGKMWKWQRKRRRPRMIRTNVTCYVIPFRKTLEQLLNNNEVLSFLKEGLNANSDGNTISDFTDGEFFINHPVLSKFINSLFPFLYTDDIQVANALGSKTKKNKMCMIYWSLGNIPPHLRSSLRAINLLGIVPSNDLKKYGLSKVLEEFMDCIKELESEAGLQLTIGNTPVVFHGTLLFVSADTPAANSLGGFKESVGRAHRPCRCCMITQTDIQTKHNTSDLVMRDKQTHTQHCNEIEAPNISKRERVYWSRLYGVTQTSILSELEHFDVTKQLVMDFMHVVLEGTALLELKHFIKYCLHEQYFTIDQFNLYISNFDFPTIFANDKPSTIDSIHLQDGHNLRQYAVQVLCLLRCIPIMFASSIPHDDPKLENLILLSKIVNYCLAYQIPKQDLHILSTMITLHNIRFTHLYPDVPLTPKFHFMHHLPQNIQQFGLLRHQWCMRFEAFHQWFKEIARISKNYKNLSFTLCNRNQMNRCMQLNYGDPFICFLSQNEYNVTNGILKQLTSINIGNDICNLLQCNITDYIFDVKKITCKGVEYCIDQVVMLKCDDNELPKFGSIIKIYMQNQKLVLQVKEYDTESYEDFLNSYHVTSNLNYSTHLVSNLPSFHILPLFKVDGEDYVMLINHTRVEFLG